MSRKRSRSKSAPSYRLHKPSGQAVVSVNGKMFYLGKYDSEESQQQYKQVLADHWSSSTAKPKFQPVANKGPVTISKLCIEFGKKCIQRHGEQSNEWKYQIQPVLKNFRATWGDTPATEFGPIRFENFRQQLVDSGLSRQVVKRKSNYIIKMFKHATKLELIPVELWWRLKSLGPVEVKFKKKKKRWSVDPALVKATQAELTPTVADMVELQMLIGARPSEICNIRPCDIDRSKDVWIYTPASHKTDHHGHGRAITIGPKAQAILRRYLLRDSQDFCFTPSDAYEQHFERRREQRQTPENCGNGPQPRKPKGFQPKYNHNSYRRAIQRAAARAFPIVNGFSAHQIGEFHAC